VRTHAPVEPGDHSDEILREAGFASDEIASLAADGIVLGIPAPHPAKASS
jgi:crotonobetainyl-CoA:carnitine CoA-transferase CaiB-like acyl-CoA transferase